MSRYNPENPCRFCDEYFNRFRCGAPDECDCPICQGYCECSQEEDEDDKPPKT